MLYTIEGNLFIMNSCNSNNSQVITRFAPSPTGFLHVGNARTALINWLYARKNKGKFILRIDDTDSQRSTFEYENFIYRDLKWLGIEWDETFKQSERMSRYQEAKQELINAGRLYPCYESTEELAIKKKSLLSRNMPPIYDRSSLKLTDEEKNQKESDGIRPHWRFLLNDDDIKWHDKIRGDMHFRSSHLSDPILFKSDGSMTYTLASVVDDMDFSISDIIRGEDHLSNSATHLQIFKALKAKKLPNLAHMCLLYNKNQEISKRIGGFDIASIRHNGIEPMTINSFLAKIGTSDSVHEYISMQEILKNFDLSKFGKASVHYDISDLERLNEKLLHHMPYAMAYDSMLEKGIEDIDENSWNLLKNNIKKLDDINIWHDICKKSINPTIINAELCQIAAQLLIEYIDKDTKELNNDWNYHNWIERIKILSKKSGKELFIPIRLAITGLQNGPELHNIIYIVGYKKTYARLMGNQA